MTDYTRREFLKISLAAAAAVKLAGCSRGSPSNDGRADSTALPRRRLGRTGQDVTILGMGTAPIAVNFKGVQCPESQTREIVETALAGGVRYFDTSPDYKHSEERLGPALAGWRDRIFLTTKTNFADRDKINEELSTSLKLLKTDHVDLLLLHCVGLTRETRDPQAVLGKGGALDTLLAAKRSGRTRFIGLSVHLPPVSGPLPENSATTTGIKLLESSDEFDVVMPWVNYVSRAMIDAESRIVEPARKKGMGVIGMKVLGGDGQLADGYDRALRYTLSVPGVACAIVGVSDAQQVRRAVQAARDFRPLTEDEMRQAVELGKTLAATRSPKALLLERHLGADLGSVA